MQNRQKSTPDQSDLFSLDDTGDVYFSQIFFSSWILKSLEAIVSKYIAIIIIITFVIVFFNIVISVIAIIVIAIYIILIIVAIIVIVIVILDLPGVIITAVIIVVIHCCCCYHLNVIVIIKSVAKIHQGLVWENLYKCSYCVQYLKQWLHLLITLVKVS